MEFPPAVKIFTSTCRCACETSSSSFMPCMFVGSWGVSVWRVLLCPRACSGAGEPCGQKGSFFKAYWGSFEGWVRQSGLRTDWEALKMEWRADTQLALRGDRVPLWIKGSLWIQLSTPFSCHLETKCWSQQKDTVGGGVLLIKGLLSLFCLPKSLCIVAVMKGNYFRL